MYSTPKLFVPSDKTMHYKKAFKTLWLIINDLNFVLKT